MFCMPVVLTGHFHRSGLAIIRTLRHLILTNSRTDSKTQGKQRQNSNSAPTEHPLGAEETVELTGPDSFPARPSARRSIRFRTALFTPVGHLTRPSRMPSSGQYRQLSLFFISFFCWFVSARSGGDSFNRIVSSFMISPFFYFNFLSKKS